MIYPCTTNAFLTGKLETQRVIFPSAATRYAFSLEATSNLHNRLCYQIVLYQELAFSF